MRRRGALPAILLSLVLAGCGAAGSAEEETAAEEEEGTNQMEDLASLLEPVPSDDAYRTGYEIFVRSFYDSDGDGIGDLNGVKEKLPYIHDDLGFDEIWLMPICPSPSYHKYDVTDYEAVDPQYGTVQDFQDLVDACHEKNVTVLTDLVVNHTSSEHPWFTAAAEYLKSLPEGEEPDPNDCPYVSYYNFTRTQQDGYGKLSGTDWYYEARFSEDMPDLNLDSEEVRGEIRDIAAFWLDLGTDGFRLDATTSYYTDSGTDTISFLSWLNDTVKEINPDAYLVGEAWTDQNTYAAYYESGVDSFFDFAFSGSEGAVAKLARGKYSALKFGTALMAEEALYAGCSPDYINAPFYTNHDMARSAGYFTADADGTQAKFAGALNLLMQGNAFVYYGEELGMKGSGKDENKRAPMVWSEDASAEGMCEAPPGMDAITMKFPSYEEQREDPWSVFTYYKTAVAIRDAFPALKKGSTEVIGSLSDEDVLVFVREERGEGDAPVLAALNAAEEEKTVSLTAESTATPYDTLSAVLLTKEGKVTLKDGTLTLPARSIAILTAD